MRDNNEEIGKAPSPLIVDRLCYEIEKRGFVHGIFRVSGAGLATKALFVAVQHLKSGDEVIFKAEPNVHNVAAALCLYLSKTDSVFPVSSYETVFQNLSGRGGQERHPAEEAVALGRTLSNLPHHFVLQRVCKMCHEISKNAETNQMTAKNLGIVLAPVFFHDPNESLQTLAANQGAKVAMLESIISLYSLAFPTPLEPVYVPPPKPGEVRLLLEREWALLLSKHAELITLAPGQVILEKGDEVQKLYRIKRGVVDVGEKKKLIAGDFFGERYFLGRPKSESRYVAREEVELWSLSPSHLELMWGLDVHLSSAFWGHVALVQAAELRAQAISEENVAASRLSRMSTAGIRLSTVLQEEAIIMGGHREDDAVQQVRQASGLQQSQSSGSDQEAVILSKECQLNKKPGTVSVTALEVRFETSSKNVFGGSKTVRIPFEAFERISTSVPDEVIRGKRHASKQFSRKGPFHTITLVVRKRKQRSLQLVQRVLNFFAEADAADTFICIGRLFQTVSEEMLADPAKKIQEVQKNDDDQDESEGSKKVVSKAVALFDYSDGANFSFKMGDLLFLTTERRDLRVRGQLVSDTSNPNFYLFPRDYVEPVVWLSNKKGLPTEADIAPIVACGTKKQFKADQVIVEEGALLDCVYYIESGICKVNSKSQSLGKMAKGDFFGDVTFLLGGPCTATITAQMDTVIVEIRREVLRSTFTIRVDLASKFYRMFAALCLRRIERNSALPLLNRTRKSVMLSRKLLDKNQPRDSGHYDALI